MKIILCTIIIILGINSSYGQFDSIIIVRTLIEPPHSIAECFEWTKSGEFKFLINMQGDSINSFSINRYKEFKSFFEEHTKKSYLKRLKKGKEQVKKGLQDKVDELKYPLYEYNIFCYKKGREYTYNVSVYSQGIKYFEEYTLIHKLERFRADFYREHMCDKFFNVYTVKEGESLKSIAKKYNIDDIILAITNHEESPNCYSLNKRKFDIIEIADGEETLQEGDRIYVPCIPKKISKYE